MSNHLVERYKACMVLSGVGDAIGFVLTSCFEVKEIDLLNFGIFVVRYRNGIWQFNTSGKEIHRELNEKFHQIENIHVERMY